MNIKNCISELLGMFALIFLGTMLLITGNYGFYAALIMGLIIIAWAYAFSDYTIQLNPVITLAYMLRNKIEKRQGILNIIFQLIGAIIGSLAVWIALDMPSSGIGENYALLNYSITATFAAELVATFILVIAVLRANDNLSNKHTGFVMGLIYVVGVMALMFLTSSGGSMNPTRSLTPAVLIGGDALSDLWIYIVAPILGSLLAVFVYAVYEVVPGEDKIEENEEISEEEIPEEMPDEITA